MVKRDRNRVAGWHRRWPHRGRDVQYVFIRADSREHGRGVVHRHTDRGGGGAVTSRIAGNGGEGGRPIEGRGVVPGDGIWSHGDFGAQVGAVELELHAADAHVV